MKDTSHDELQKSWECIKTGFLEHIDLWRSSLREQATWALQESLMKLLRPKASELMASIPLRLDGVIEMSCVLGKMDIEAATEIRQSIDETIAEAQEQDVLTKLLAISQSTFEDQTDVQTMQGALDTVRANIICKPDFFAGGGDPR